MARYLLVPLPLHGHVHPMVALAAELVEHGEEVVVAINPSFAGPFRDVGCEVAEFDIMERGPVPENPTVAHKLGGFGRIWDIVRERFRVTGELRAAWPRLRPDVVVTDIMSIWGIKAAEAAGVPFVSFYVTYALSERILLEDVNRKFGPRVMELARRSGIARIQPGLRRRVTRNAALALVNVLPELQPMRWSFDGRFRFVGPLRRDSGEFQEFHEVDLPWERIRSGRTLYVSTGTLFTRGAEFFRKVAWAFGGSEWFVVMATSHTDPAELGELPENVVARRYVPQSAVLEHCSAFITHGGMNSALEGLALRIPMVLVPRAYDQRGIARRVAELGAGVIVEAGSPGRAFREAVDRVAAADEVTAALEQLSGRVAQANGLATAVEELRKLAADR